MPLPSKVLVCVAALWLGSAASAQDTPPTMESLKAEEEYLKAKLECVRIEIAYLEHLKRVYPTKVDSARLLLYTGNSFGKPYVESAEDRQRWAMNMLKRKDAPRTRQEEEARSFVARFSEDKAIQKFRSDFAEARQDARDKEAI